MSICGLRRRGWRKTETGCGTGRGRGAVRAPLPWCQRAAAGLSFIFLRLPQPHGGHTCRRPPDQRPTTRSETRWQTKGLRSSDSDFLHPPPWFRVPGASAGRRAIGQEAKGVLLCQLLFGTTEAEPTRPHGLSPFRSLSPFYANLFDGDHKSTSNKFPSVLPTTTSLTTNTYEHCCLLHHRREGPWCFSTPPTGTHRCLLNTTATTHHLLFFFKFLCEFEL